MNKSIQIMLVFLFASSVALCQGARYPKGAYLSFDEIKLKSPSVSVELSVEKRTKGDIKMNGGNDYRLYIEDKSIPKKVIKKEYIGYSDGDTLYLNGIHYKIQTWYAPVLSDGEFLVIKAGLSMVPKIQKEQLDNREQLGYMFGAIGGAFQGAKLALLRFVYVIDKESNEITTVSTDYLKEILSSNKQLLEQYEAEDKPSNQEIFIRYLKLLNESKVRGG